VVEIMVEILSTLALATKQVKQGRLSESCSRWCEALTQHGTGKIVKKSLRENGTEAVLHRLDRLTQDEARATGALTLETICGLIRHRRVVMGGEQPVPAMVVAHDGPRRQGVSRQSSGSSRPDFLVQFRRFEFSDMSLELMQRISNDIHRSKREFFLTDAVSD